MKQCSKCKEVKSIEEFDARRASADGLSASCKECCKKYKTANKDKIKLRRKKYRKENADRILKYERELRLKNKDNPEYKQRKKERDFSYRQSNKDKLKDRDRKRRFLNKTKFNERSRKYHHANKDRLNKRAREYQQINKSILMAKKRDYARKRKQSDPFFKLKTTLRGVVRDGIKRYGYRKRSQAHILLGADYQTVIEHLKATAINNYGSYDPNAKYHIDHKIPCSSAITEEELIKLQHYTNLQYLTPADNLSKGDKLDWKLDKPNL